MVPDTYCSPEPGVGYQCPEKMVCKDLDIAINKRGFNGFDELRKFLFTFSVGQYMSHIIMKGACWLSGRASDSRVRGRGFKTYLHCVVSLSKTLNSSKVLLIPRKLWLCPNMTEKLLNGTLSLYTNKQNIIIKPAFCMCKNKVADALHCNLQKQIS